MKEVSVLVGKWAGEARLLRGPTEWVDLLQTEEAQFKLDGLIVVIEGVGRTKTAGQPLLQAFGIISYDDENGTYHFRAINDGRYLETTLKLLEESRGNNLGLCPGIRTNSISRINERGERVAWRSVQLMEMCGSPVRLPATGSIYEAEFLSELPTTGS